MLDAIKPLLDSGIINEETQQAISEAWESKLTEAREQLRAELREEFAERYEHDKSVMVEALDKMVTESLTSEIEEFQAEKSALAEDRAKFNTRMMESAERFDQFMIGKLAEEIKELRQDRKAYESKIAHLEGFVTSALAEEIQEFDQDKKAVVETKVRLIAEAKTKMAEIQANFVKKASALVKESVTKNLEAEMTQLKEDITVARENMFGRRLFEAFASEFAMTHLNENKEIAKLRESIAEKEQQLSEAVQAAEAKAALVESKEKEIRIIKESAERKSTMADLLKPLSKEKAAVMSELLESVQTEKLQAAYDKYLPAVLNSGSTKATQKQVVAESRVEVTGDKTANKTVAAQDDGNVIEIKRLAGLK